MAYIDFTTVGVDNKGRYSYALSSNQYDWTVNGGSSKMALAASGLTVVGTITPSSDKRLKFNKQPLVNALGIINKLVPVEYDQTFDLV